MRTTTNPPESAIIFRQLTINVKMSIGLNMNRIFKGPNWLQFKCSGRYWMRITLNGMDLYDIKVERVKRRKRFEPQELVLVEEETDVFVEDLNTVVLRLGDRA